MDLNTVPKPTTILFYMEVKQMSVTIVSLTSSVSLKVSEVVFSCFPSMGEAPECPCMQVFAQRAIRSGQKAGLVVWFQSRCPNSLSYNEKTR